VQFIWKLNLRQICADSWLRFSPNAPLPDFQLHELDYAGFLDRSLGGIRAMFPSRQQAGSESESESESESGATGAEACIVFK